MPDELFSPNHEAASRRFREAALAAGATLDSLSISALGPEGRNLDIDLAWIGPQEPRRVLLHTAGLHGVEGFSGSAIQLAALANLPTFPADAAVVFVHVLNPYGMAWLRRVNENNVDLNRNFLAPEEEFRGVSEAYHKLTALLNPQSPPSPFDLFLPRTGLAILRHGYRNLREAIAEGQYEFPQGLFFGGRELQESAAVALGWVKSRFAGLERLFVIDIHTGLGRYGEDALLTDYPLETAAGRKLRDALGPRLQAWHKSGVAYQIRGGFVQALSRELPGVQVISVGQEFGTYAAVKVIHSLREENRQHHWGDKADLAHPAKQRLVEVFSPADEVWRSKIVKRGEELFAKVVAELL